MLLLQLLYLGQGAGLTIDLFGIDSSFEAEIWGSLKVNSEGGDLRECKTLEVD